MKNIIEILQWLGILPATVHLVSEEAQVAAVRKVLSDRCPLCEGRLSGHRYRSFAAFRIGGLETETRQVAREKLLTEMIDRLPTEGANEPASDVVWYAILICPIRQEDVVIEHFSGAGVLSEESFVPLFDTTKQRRDLFKMRVHEWLAM